jgi:hypothetical protein
MSVVVNLMVPAPFGNSSSSLPLSSLPTKSPKMLSAATEEDIDFSFLSPIQIATAI